MAPSPPSSYSGEIKLENSSTLIHSHPGWDKARSGQHILPGLSQALVHFLPSILQLPWGEEKEIQFYFWASLSFPKPYCPSTLLPTELKLIHKLGEGKLGEVNTELTLQYQLSPPRFLAQEFLPKRFCISLQVLFFFLIVPSYICRSW